MYMLGYLQSDGGGGSGGSGDTGFMSGACASVCVAGSRNGITLIYMHYTRFVGARTHSLALAHTPEYIIILCIITNVHTLGPMAG